MLTRKSLIGGSEGSISVSIVLAECARLCEFFHQYSNSMSCSYQRSCAAFSPCSMLPQPMFLFLRLTRRIWNLSHIYCAPFPRKSRAWIAKRGDLSRLIRCRISNVGAEVLTVLVWRSHLYALTRGADFATPRSRDPLRIFFHESAVVAT